jgi:hypothetical protein
MLCSCDGPPHPYSPSWCVSGPVPRPPGWPAPGTPGVTIVIIQGNAS